MQWITPALREQVDQILTTIPTGTQDICLLDTWLLPVCAVSPYMARVASQYPQSIQQLLNTGALQADYRSPDTAHLLDELDSCWQEQLESSPAAMDSKQREARQQALLRQFRHRHLFRILWNELTHSAELMRTLEDLSLLADACIIAAERWTHESLIMRYGEPCNTHGRVQRLIVLGMGKLGGYELNVSSDIDLICLYAESGQTGGDARGKSVIDNGEFFRRVAQGLTRLLNSTTADGFAYRVDTRLRPFGESGPLVMNLDGLENYYLTQARDWERYAMIKARAITGLPEDIREYQSLVTPFVYRRYLDYNAFDSLRDLKRKIALSVRKKGMVDNIKLGAGGIREVEFIGQAFQLVRGGRDKRLRSRSIVAVLNQLAHEKLLDHEEVEGLLQAYGYLRRVENAVQMMRDEQVHSLPTDSTDKQRLIAMLDVPDWDTFRQTLTSHQQRVTDSFAGLFEVEEVPDLKISGRTDAKESDDDDDADVAACEDGVVTEKYIARVADTWRLIGVPDTDDAERSEALRYCGFEPDDEMLSGLAGVSRGPFYQRLTAESQERVERVVPMIMQLALCSAEPSATLIRSLALVRSVAGRSGYLQVLGDHPHALARLVKLFAESRWLANFVMRQPMVIDELLIGSGAELYPDQDSVRQDALEQLDLLRDADLETQMDTLRHYRQGREMRIACAQLDGSLPVMQVSDQLSWLAESLIEVVLELVKVPLLARHGQPVCQPEGAVDSEPRETSVGIIAYGKLGGVELGFGSDLDLVFLHDSSGVNQQTNGEKCVENSVFYGRLAQKFVHFMSTATPAGVLYEIDLRLRPNGSSGVLVTGLEAFGNYQRGDAWTWEHQALMRARVVLGDCELRRQFDQIRTGVLTQRRSASELREAVASMRERMRVNLGANRADSMHLKQDAGGVADIEFIVQYLVLAHSADHPSLLNHTDNIRVLDAVEAEQLLPAADVEILRDSYLSLRYRLHRQALQEALSIVPLDDALIQLRDGVIILRTRILGPAPALAAKES